ncbi:hypothetical protein OA56_09760 [Tepidiphilus sp. HLB4]
MIGFAFQHSTKATTADTLLTRYVYLDPHSGKRIDNTLPFGHSYFLSTLLGNNVKGSTICIGVCLKILLMNVSIRDT